MATGAKPKKTQTFGYMVNGRQNSQVKIATSNLFIETGTLPIDDMTGAIFDDIGGNEFINGGSSEIILQQGNSLITNANDVLQSVSSRANEKQADGTDTILSQFQISLNSYLPTNINSPLDFIGVYDVSDPLGTYVQDTFIEKNVYFDADFTNICIELSNLADDEEVEVEFITSSTFSSGII
jgi:hypothetical protein